MNRRHVITLLGSAAAWPVAGRAQQRTLPVIGFLHSGSPETATANVAAYVAGLGETGYAPGQNVTIEYRWARNELSRLPELAADLVRSRVNVIVTPGSIAAALAAKAATGTIPIVFSTGVEPVQAGLVGSISRPGGNLTGISYMNVEISAKRLSLLNEMVPGTTPIAAFVNPDNSPGASTVKDFEGMAAAIGRKIEIFFTANNRSIDDAFDKFAQRHIGALFVSNGPPFGDRRIQLVTLAARYGVPAVFGQRAFAEAGGLMSYGSNAGDEYRQVGIYTGRVLKGEKPSELPVMRPTKFEFVINLQTAKALGIDVSPTLLAIADEVIE